MILFLAACPLLLSIWLIVLAQQSALRAGAARLFASGAIALLTPPFALSPAAIGDALRSLSSAVAQTVPDSGQRVLVYFIV